MSEWKEKLQKGGKRILAVGYTKEVIKDDELPKLEVVASVILDPNSMIEGINDSKKISEKVFTDGKSKTVTSDDGGSNGGTTPPDNDGNNKKKKILLFIHFIHMMKL